MKRKLIFLMIFILNVVLAVNLSAFCVYNYTDVVIEADELHGGKAFKDFRQVINPGEKKCCHWSNKDCNKQGKRDSLLVFLVNGAVGGKTSPEYTMCYIKIKAGGVLIVEGKKNSYYKCIAKDY